MIFHGRVGVTVRTVIGRDAYGNDIYGDTTTDYPGEVRPSARPRPWPAETKVSSRYRVFLPPSAAGR